MIRSRLVTCLAIAALCTTPILVTAPDTLAEANTLAAKPIKGTVLETMNSGGYTYMQIEAPEGSVWVAIPEGKVEKGQEVACNPGMTMTSFESTTLNRTFDTIIFSSGISNGNKPVTPQPHGSSGMASAPATGGASFSEALQAEQQSNMAGGAAMGAAMENSGGSTTAIVPSSDITVKKAEGDNAVTVGECFEQTKDLNNKKVKIRGKVVKVSPMIMGKNWLHIQDGTGNPMNNSHDLVVTTMDKPDMDSIVVIEGTLHADKDFGAGYKYAVIIEDAEVK